MNEIGSAVGVVTKLMFPPMPWMLALIFWPWTFALGLGVLALGLVVVGCILSWMVGKSVTNWVFDRIEEK